MNVKNDRFIRVAGRDAAEELNALFQRELPRMEASHDCVFLPDHLSARQLSHCSNALEYNQTFSHLLFYRNHVDTQAFHISRRPGPAGWVLAQARKFMWRVLRYQHDRMFFRQNLINSHVTSLLDSQSNSLSREVDELKARLAVLENRNSASENRHDS
jgi:hypothetical protein